MQGHMRIERLTPTGTWKTEHAGEFCFTEDEVVNAVTALLDAYTDGDPDFDRATLRLCVWPEEVPEKKRELARASAVFGAHMLDFDDAARGTWGPAAHLLRWGGLKSFSCLDKGGPASVLMSLPLPFPLPIAPDGDTRRVYFYHPANGIDSEPLDREEFDYVLRGYMECWLTQRAAADSSTWLPGEARKIASRLAKNTWTESVRTLHASLGPEAHQSLHELAKELREELEEAGDDQAARDAIQQRYNIRLVALRSEFEAKADA